jgi:serine phosphatase RsbU (regulator of sigma subunit)
VTGKSNPDAIFPDACFRGERRTLKRPASVLGIFKKWDCEIGERTLCPGDTFALYTDGITEAFNENRGEFGEDRLITPLRRHRSLPSQSILDSIVADVRQFHPHEQHDDITLIIAKSAPCNNSSPRLTLPNQMPPNLLGK